MAHVCKKDEVLSAQAIRWGLSTTLFDRLRRQKHVPMLLDVQLLASRQRERADTFCRGFVDGVHWLHQYWSITITYFPKTLDSPSCRLLFFAFQWDWCSVLLFTGGSACILCFVPSQQQHSMVDKSKRVSTSPLSSWRSSFEETRKICAYCIVMHSLHSGIVVKPSTSRGAMIFARCVSFRRGVHGREKQIGSSFCNSSEASHECCSCSKDFKGM